MSKGKRIKEARKEVKEELTETEVFAQANKLFKEKKAKANKEIGDVLNKYGFDINIEHVIQFIPRR